MSNINIFLLDNSNNSKEEKNIIRPKTYQQLLSQISKKFRNISEYFEVFIIDKNNKEIKINSEEQYKEIGDILFVREINEDILKKSIYDMNYNKLSESKQEILDEKYNCILCSIIIKNEKPYLCYKCQKIFHEKCLKDWDKKCKTKKKILTCPNCRNELPIEKWNKKLNHEENRKDNAILMNKINEYKLNNNMNNNINKIKDRKINELKENGINKEKIIKEYENYINKTIEIFKNLLNKINDIHTLLKLERNDKLEYLINKYSLNIKNLDISNISNVINEELDNFYISLKNSINTVIINDTMVNKDNFNLINDNNLEKVNKLKVDEYKDKINLIYFANYGNNYRIFGNAFVNNNADNIELIINGKQSKLVSNCILYKGENIITLIIKKKLKDLSKMFYMCDNVKDISQLEYLYINEVKDFSYMFYECKSLTNIKSLQKWNVSSSNDFSYMFGGCTSLLDIESLQNWNVSKSNNFSFMFYKCESLKDIKPLQNWNVSNSNNFSYMFCKCKLLSNINCLQNWNVSNGNNFSNMFGGCSLLTNIEPLKNWDVSSCDNFSNMFRECSLLSDIKPLKNWNVSKGNNFSYMFYECKSLSDIKSLQNWNVSKGNNFSCMFRDCSPLIDIKPLQKWNISNNDMNSLI